MEQERVYKMFDEKFKEHKDVPMALYGLGINTKYLMEKAAAYNIIGIVANDRIGEYVYGKKVMSIEDIEDKARIVVIVAQMKSVKIIYNRIKHLEDKGIDIYDFWGEKIVNDIENARNEFKSDSYWNSNFSKLKDEIDRHDIISFDVFDTLLMRKILKPDQILDVVEEYLKENGFSIEFKIERVKAEQQLLYKGIVPTIKDIYKKLSINIGITQQLADWLMSIELKTENRFVTKRQCVVDALEYAIEKGKQVYLLEDTCLSSEQIYELLLKCSITDVNINQVLVSSEIKKTKRDASLFEYFVKYVGKGLKLHIGSSTVLDIHIPQRFGINTYFVMSAYDMFLKSAVADVIKNAETINDYILLGLFSAKAFNNPFAFYESNGKLIIESLYDLGYYCFGPITVKFLIWVVKQLRNIKNSIVLFSSRDGYFIHKLYRNLREKNVSLDIPKEIYFYISRRAVTVINIKTENDIVEIVEDVLKISIGNLMEILEQRLGIQFDKNDVILNQSLIEVTGEKDKDKIIQRVLEYKEAILKNSALEREYYLGYIKNINLQEYKKIYLFDLYTKGTSIYNLSRIIGRDLDLICYGIKNFPNEYISNDEKAKSMFSHTVPTPIQWFERSYQMLEVIYSSSEGQFKSFTKDGTPQFVENSEYNYRYIKEAQLGILDFINNLEILDENWFEKKISLNMVEAMNKMMERKQSITNEYICTGFTYYDSFASEATINIWDRII